MKAFSRSMAIFAAMSAMIKAQSKAVTLDEAAKYQRAIDAKGAEYYSRGKGGRKSPRTATGVARAKRAAKKAHNIRIRSAH